MDLNSIAIQFYNAGLKYSTAIQPYALKLFFALFLIEIIVTWIQYSAEGQLDPSYFLGRMLKRIASLRHGGIAWLRARPLVAELRSAAGLLPSRLLVL